MQTLSEVKTLGWQYKLLVVTALFCCSTSDGQQIASARMRIGPMTNTIFLEAGSNYVLDFSYRVPDLWVGNPSVTSASPVAPNQIMIIGLTPGVSTLTVSDPAKRLQAITVHVRHNVRSLEAAVRQHFPNAVIQVHALNQGVVLRGEMGTADEVSNLIEIANDFFPEKIINQVTVSGSQMIAINVRVYEVSRQKLRQLGVDWSVFGDEFAVVQSISGLIQNAGGAGVTSGTGAQTLSFGVLNDDFALDVFLKALVQRNLAKLLDEPTLVTSNGRSAEFLSGGEVPIQISTNFGGTSLEYRAFGTKLDIIPLIQGHGEMMLEVRAEVSDVAGDLSGGTNSPGFRVRRVNTGVQMKAGQTLALAGDYREETETIVRGIPGLMDIPGLGAIFRDTSEQTTETELVFLITPKFISPTNAGVSTGPGRSSQPPSDHDFYHGGSVEVPGRENPGNYNFGYGGHSEVIHNFSSPPAYGSNATPNYVPSQNYSPIAQPSVPQYVPNQRLPAATNGFSGEGTTRITPSPSVLNPPPQNPNDQPNTTSPIEGSSPPAKDLNLSNPFESRASPEFNGPYGFSG